MSAPMRLAIIDRGEAAARVIAAVGDLNRNGHGHLATTVAVHPGSKARAWYAREADETLELPTDGSTPLPPSQVVTALRGAGIDSVWVGHTPCDVADLVAECEAAGMTVVGPTADTIRRLGDPAGFRAVAEEADVPVLPDGKTPSGFRMLEAEVICDGTEDVVSLGLRDVSVRRGGHGVLTEYPAQNVSQAVADGIAAALRRLARATAYRGAAIVRIALDPATDEFWCLNVDVLARPENALLEEGPGTSVVAARLDVTRGQIPSPVATHPEGHTVEVRILAQDPERGFAPSGGSVELLSLPASSGVRVDTSLREGDIITPGEDPLIATVTAWGHTREQALSRLRRSLERMVVVLEQGVSNRSNLLAILDRPELHAGPLAVGWYEEVVATGELEATPDPLALLSAAIEAYEADLAMVRHAFLASASRGRPERPEDVGARIVLHYAGVDYTVRVDRTGPSSYRVAVGGTAVELTYDRLGPFERRAVLAGRKHRVISIEQGATFRIEVDGVAHSVVREDGIVVRTGWPALVESLLVAVGDEVTQEQPLATLESMKMVATVTSPFDGVVTSIAVLPNSQVERGAALLRIRAADDAAVVEQTPDDAQPLDLSPLAAQAAPAVDGDDATRVYDRLRNYLLGYDLDPSGLKSLVAEHKALTAGADATDPEILALENAFIDLYADIEGLYRPRTEAEIAGDPTEEVAGANTQEFFIAFLQWLDPDLAGLPEGYRRRLEAALSRYGVHGLGHNRQLEVAMLWMFRSFARVSAMASVVTAILGRRLAHPEEIAAIVGPEGRERLVRLARAAQGREETVASLALDAVFSMFDEPVMEAAVADVETEMAEHLQALKVDPQREDRADRVARLVWCPHPMRSMLLHAWLDAVGDPGADGFRRALLEAYARRFYRIRDLRGLDHVESEGIQLAFGNYDHEDKAIHLVVAFTELSGVPDLSRAVARHLESVGEDREVVVDIHTWRDGPCPHLDEQAAEVASLLQRCAFGRRLHRFDLTITSLGGVGKENRRTQHLTYRQDDEGAFVEETLYRNLHPMLGKRLDLWRLSNFTLERLPSPEDVYLFSGIAKDNPKDHRLFALAEVRDLVAVRDEQTGATSYPRLGRIGLEALAAMRTALASYPARSRPQANRLILSVRPTWDVPSSEWAGLADTYEPLARGVGLEKLVLHIRVPEEKMFGRKELVEKVLFVEGIGRGGGLSVRLGEPGPNPIRPLTAYAQKVLTAARFGSPYPYEIARMLTPAQGESSDFPHGEFQELDLDGEGQLVPVDREPGQNRAHIVIGEIVNYTDVVPEGVRRVAMLSDPTQGLGNLAEPECRRINAALEYAMERRIPVEWYAVSSGALIAMDSGTENMDWIALTLRRLIEYTQAGGEVNIIVTGINVGGQPYWNAEATMLMHTKGILIMTPASAMVLTGKQALDFSGAVSAEDNFGIGGYDRIMGLNGQGQYWAPSFEAACGLLLKHYDYTYVVPGQRFPRRRPTADPIDRDVRQSPHAKIAASSFTSVADVFGADTNPDRKEPFDMRSVMRAVTDTDCEPIERWRHWENSDTSIVWDATVGGIPVCMLGLEAHRVQRKGFVPSYGPPAWTSGTLFPQSSRKTARAVNAASGNRPLVVMANLSGFDGSPESMRNWQLEYGAEIGRAVTNFDGPIVFVVVSRYHGGAFVVFSKQLNEAMEIAAVEGAYASVIGGAPAAATVFARDVKKRTMKDSRVVEATQAASAASGPGAAALRAKLAEVTAAVRSEKLGEVADEFDGIHTIDRALRVGSVDRIITAQEIRPWIIDALERGMAKFAIE